MKTPDTSCPIARTARIIGDEWVLLVLRELFREPQRFDDLQKRTGAATNILASRLKRLVEAGLVEKEPYQARPLRYAYQLTRRGLALFPALLELMRFGMEWLPVDTPPPFRLVHADCGKMTLPGQVCTACGRPVKLGNVRMLPAEPAADTCAAHAVAAEPAATPERSGAA